MKTWHWVVIILVVGFVGFFVYWFGFRKKKSVVPPIGPQPPIQNQTTANKILGFAESEGKKAFGGFLNDLLS